MTTTPIMYVLGFRFNEEKNEVVLIKKIKPEPIKGMYNGIGGKVEPTDPSLSSAMAREFLEETGVETASTDWKLEIVIKDARFDMYIFSSYGDISDCHTMEEEEVYIGVVGGTPTNPTNLPFGMVQNLYWIIPFLLDPEPAKPLTVFFSV